MKISKKRQFMLVGATVFLCMVILISVLMTKVGPQQKITNQLELGNKYLTEMNYEQAIVVFEQVIEIDPMNADAYVGLTDAYICLNKFDKAYETAKQGYDKTGDERLNEKILMIESGNIVDFEDRTHKLTQYSADGDIEFETYFTYSYNEYGLITDTIRLVYEEGHIREEIHEMKQEYDQSDLHNGMQRRYRFAPETGEIIGEWLDVWEYDKNTRTEKFTTYDVDIKTGEKLVNDYWTKEYDETNKLIAGKFYDGDGSLNGRYEMSYDSNGNCTEERHYDANGHLTLKSVRIYDKNGKYIGYKDYDESGNVIDYVALE